MNVLTETKFVLALEEASQTKIVVSNDILKNEYEEFVALVFLESRTANDREGFLNILNYTCIELSSLIPVTKKKCFCLS